MSLVNDKQNSPEQLRGLMEVAENLEARAYSQSRCSSLEILRSWLVLSHQLLQQLQAKSRNSPSLAWLSICPSRKAKKDGVLNYDLINKRNSFKYSYDSLT